MIEKVVVLKIQMTFGFLENITYHLDKRKKKKLEQKQMRPAPF